MESEDPDRVIRDVGRRVAEVRVQRGLTQDKLAEMLGVSGVYVRRVEIGRENLTLRSLTRIASTLGVPVADLFASPQSREVRVGRPPRRADAPSDPPGESPAGEVVEGSTVDPPTDAGNSAEPVDGEPAPLRSKDS